MNYNRIAKKERGQSLVEYAMLLMLVAIVLIVLVALFGTNLRSTYCRVLSELFPDMDLSGTQCDPSAESYQLPYSAPGYVDRQPAAGGLSGPAFSTRGANAAAGLYLDGRTIRPFQTSDRHQS